MRDERRLAGADFTRNDDEAFTLRQTISEIGQSLAVRDRAEVEFGIGRELEWFAAQAIEIVEHCLVLPWTCQKV